MKITPLLLSIRQRAFEDPSRLAIITPNRSLTYAALAELIFNRIDELRSNLDPRRRDRVVIYAKSSADFIIDFLATFGMGLPVGLIHPRWTSSEIKRFVDRLAPRLILESDGKQCYLAPRQHTDGFHGVYVATSGSRGRPKLVQLSDDALRHATSNHTRHLPWQPNDRWLLAMPPAHIGGLSIIFRCLYHGQCIVTSSQKFETKQFIHTLEAQHVTLLSLVPTMLHALVNAQLQSPHSIRAVLLGGAACSTQLLEAGRELGWPLLTTYGLTECCAQVATQTLSNPCSTGVGTPLPGVQVRIRREQIEVYSESLLDGYLDQPTPLTPDGYFRTSDRGYLDPNGHLHVLGRSDDVIVSGGENIDPLEVEHALESLSEIKNAIVFPQTDNTWGQRVFAAVIPNASYRAISTASIRARLRPKLASYKIPKEVICVDALPQTSSGKKNRLQMKAHFESMISSQPHTGRE